MDLSGDWDYIEAVAQARLANNKGPHHVSCYGTEIETIGAAGELAARRCLHLSEDLHVHRDNGTDIEWRGWKIDVKTTQLTPLVDHRFLQWPEGKPIKCDIVLMAAVDVKSKRAKVLGFVASSDIARAPVNPNRRFPCHEIPVKSLIPTNKLYELAKRHR